MPISPRSGSLTSIGDVLVATLEGDPTVLFTLAGSFTGFTVAVEVLPFGSTQYVPLTGTRTDTGQLVPGTITISGSGQGTGTVIRADGRGYSNARLRVTSAGSGTIAAGISSVGFPTGSPVTNVTGTVNLGGGFTSVYNQIIVSPAQPLSILGTVPGSTATSGVGAQTAPMLGDALEGARVYDQRLRELIIQMNDWQRKIFYVLVYFAGGGALTGNSPQEYLQSLGVDVDPLDAGQEDQLSPLGDYHG